MTSLLHGTIPLKVMEEDLPRREGVGPEGRALHQHARLAARWGPG